MGITGAELIAKKSVIGLKYGLPSVPRPLNEPWGPAVVPTVDGQQGVAFFRSYGAVRCTLERTADCKQLKIALDPNGNCLFLPWYQIKGHAVVNGVTWTQILPLPSGAINLFVTGPFSGCDFVTRRCGGHALAAHVAGSKNDPNVKHANYQALAAWDHSFTFTEHDVKFEWDNAPEKVRETSGVIVGAYADGNWKFYYTRPGRKMGWGEVYTVNHDGLA